MTRLQKFQQQFERVKRFYELFRKIDEGVPINFPTNYLEDIVYSFFIFCYHLKDWIINDDTVEMSEKEVENFINQNECLTICANLCNGIKHYKLRSKHGRHELGGEFKTKKVYAEYAGGTSLNIRIKFNILTPTKDIDAFKLATECLQKWEEFIKGNIEKNI